MRNPTSVELEDALVVADDACGYPLDVLEMRAERLEDYPAIRQQIIAEIVRRRLRT
jgi:hypothetical protein